MNAQLVKVDVAADLLGKSVGHVFQLAEGGCLGEPGFEWVFNLANNLAGDRRDLRFWRPEIVARVEQSRVERATSPVVDGNLPSAIDDVINTILPERRQVFYAGELDTMFQIRPRTRIDLHSEIVGELKSGCNFYSRRILVEFLRRRWLRVNVPVRNAKGQI